MAPSLSAQEPLQSAMAPARAPFFITFLAFFDILLRRTGSAASENHCRDHQAGRMF